MKTQVREREIDVLFLTMRARARGRRPDTCPAISNLPSQPNACLITVLYTRISTRHLPTLPSHQTRHPPSQGKGLSCFTRDLPSQPKPEFLLLFIRCMPPTHLICYPTYPASLCLITYSQCFIYLNYGSPYF